jgi:hypothetical protein
MMRAMRGRSLSLVAVVTVVLWVVSGPIGMAFDGCAMMGEMCGAPCGLLSYVSTPTVTIVAALQPAADLQRHPTASPTLFSLGPPTPPPKFSLLST